MKSKTIETDIMEKISTPEMRRLVLNQLKCIAEI